jgi:AcrR family transcriptional regulator
MTLAAVGWQTSSVAVGLRERKKEQTREALAQAVITLATTRGFDNVTVEDIADACDVSPRTFFRYFPSKEDALFAGNSAQRDSVLAAIEAQPPELSAFEAIEAAVRTLVVEYEAGRKKLRRRHRIVVASPSLQTRSAERAQSWEADLVDHLRASGRASELTDIELRLVVAATLAALRLAVDAWLLSDDAGALHDLFERGFRLLGDGLRR